MKKILIALDYDPSAQKVAEAGFALAKSMGAEVTLLHVIADPMYYISDAYSPIMGFGGYVGINFLQSDIVDDIRKASEDFLDKSKEHLNDDSIETVVKIGGIADTILETGKELDADIIVVGSHSKRWLEKITLGSEAEKVLQHTSVPLLVIPTGKKK